MRHLIPVVTLAFALSACASAEERRARELAADRETCVAYGIAPGHQDFADCMIVAAQLRLQDKAIEEQWRATVGAAALGANPALIRALQPQRSY